jgi:cytochrome c551/c552
MKISLVRIVLAVVIVLIGIQFIPVNLSNPPVEEEFQPSPDVKVILKRACYDCHSNETIWPAYSQVAPISWLLAWDVREGREELNFSTWNRYSQKKRDKIIKEIWEEVAEGEMPPWFYLPLHPDAWLSDSDRSVLQRWAKRIPSVSKNEDDK